MRSPFFGEFMGTLVMILLGDGVVAGVLLKRSKAENSGWMVITTGWAFAVLGGIFTAVLCGSVDAHLNPAITLAFAIKNQDFSKLLPFATAQLLGAFTGAVLVWVHYGPHWKESSDADLKRAVFCTSPAIRKPIANLVSEDHRDRRSCTGSRCDQLETGALDRRRCRTYTLSGELSGMGHWTLARWYNRLRNQSCP